MWSLGWKLGLMGKWTCEVCRALNTRSIWIARKLLIVEFLSSWNWWVKFSVTVNVLTCCIMQVWFWLRVWASGMNYPIVKLNSWHQTVSPWRNFYSFFLFFFNLWQRVWQDKKQIYVQRSVWEVGWKRIYLYLRFCSFRSCKFLSPDWNERERQLFEGTLIGLFLLPLFSALKKYSFG